MPSRSRWQTSCDRCGLKFQYLNQLKSHVTINHEVGDFPFKCRFCEKGFFFQNKLDIHVRTHTDDNPYECKECGMKFKQKPDLNKHDLVHSSYKTGRQRIRNLQILLRGTSLTPEGRARKDRIVARLFGGVNKTLLVLNFYAASMEKLKAFNMAMQKTEPQIHQLHAEQEKLTMTVLAMKESIDLTWDELKKKYGKKTDTNFLRNSRMLLDFLDY